MTVATLLPSNRTPFEVAVSKVGAERRPLPVDLVKSVWNPDTCPENLLGWLAWQLSVDVWDPEWSETTKREACRKAFLMHRLKTTPAGIKQHVALAGSEVRKVVRPPGRGFIYAAMTPEQRKTWLDSLAQIRIYPFVHGGIAKSRLFMSGPGGRQFMSSHTAGSAGELDITDDNDEAIEGFGGGAVYENITPADDAVNFITGFARKSRGLALLGRRATYYDHGVETDVIYDGFDGQGIEQIRFGKVRKRQWYGHAYIGHAFTQVSLAPEGVVNVAISPDAPLSAIAPSVTPVFVQSQRVAQQRTMPAARAAFGGHALGRFMRRTHAPFLVYDRLSLNDPNRMGSRRKTRSYYGHGRFGIADYTAELTIRVPMRRNARRAARWMGVGHMKAPDMKPLDMAIEAVRASKAFRDTVLIDTTTYRVVEFGGSLTFGGFTLGELKEVA